MSRATRPQGPLDVALEQLRAHSLSYRWTALDLKVWESPCPACRFPDWSLRIREGRHGGPITLICKNGCTDPEIRAALEREPVEPRIEEALALAEQARDLAATALELTTIAVTPELAVAA